MAASLPKFRLNRTPTTRGSRTRAASTAAQVPSEEPSSTKMSS